MHFKNKFWLDMLLLMFLTVKTVFGWQCLKVWFLICSVILWQTGTAFTYFVCKSLTGWTYSMPIRYIDMLCKYTVKHMERYISKHFGRSLLTERYNDFYSVGQIYVLFSVGSVSSTSSNAEAKNKKHNIQETWFFSQTHALTHFLCTEEIKKKEIFAYNSAHLYWIVW